MGTAGFRKTLTITGTLLSGGISIGLISVVSEIAEAAKALN
jgi:hypothetical protein